MRRIQQSAGAGPAVLVAAATLLFVGCGDDDIQHIDNEPPVADAGPPVSAAAGSVVTFDGSGSDDPDGTIVEWRWTFGDGATGVGETVNHVYNAGGTFTVTLTVTDDRGATDEDTTTATIEANEAPIAVIVAPESAAIGASIRFDGSDSYDPDGTIATYDWDLGDGTQATGPQRDHSFDAAGVYTVTLTVTDDKGAVGTAEHDVTVAEGPLDYSGQWNWSLVDPADATHADCMGDVAPFQPSQLTIAINGFNISITESGGGHSQTYTGTFDDPDFHTTYSGGFGSTETIAGTFTSPTTFEGYYGLSIPGVLDDCPDRDVTGVKVGN
jgi:PKD repeat protein